MLTRRLSSDCSASSSGLSLPETCPPCARLGRSSSDISPSWQLAFFGKALWVQHTTSFHEACSFCICEKPWETGQKRRFCLTYAGRVQKLVLVGAPEYIANCVCTAISCPSQALQFSPSWGFFFFKLNSTMIWLIQFFASFVRVLGKMKQWKNKFSQNLERYTKKSSFTLASFFKMWFNDSFNKDGMSPYQGLVFLLLRWRMRWAGSCPHKAFSLVEKEMEGGRRNRCAGRVSSMIKIRE